MHIIQIANDEDKKSITRNILEELPEWFGIPEAREEYIRDSAGKVFFCAMENEKDLGFLYLKETGKDTVELAVMGVLKEYHRKGIGKELFNRAKKAAKEMGYSFICFVCLYPYIGIIGGIGVGYSAGYAWQTVFNTFGALSIASGLFGAAGAVALRIGANVFGSVYTVLFDKAMNGLIQLVNSRECRKAV